MSEFFGKAGTKFAESGKMLSKPQNLTVSAMLLALAVVFKYFENMGMAFLGTNLIKIGFSVFPIAVAGMLYGPIVSGIVGGLTDVLGYIIAPQGGAYVPCFTISMILLGMIYGISFYKEKIGLKRLIITELIITIFINIILGVTWFVLFFGMPLEKALSIRGIKEFFDLPLTVFINYMLYKVIVKIPEVKHILKKSKA